MFFFELQGRLERIGVGLVNFEFEAGFVDPITGGGDAERRVAQRNLLNRDNNFHLMSNDSDFLKIRQPLVPPKPKELDSA